MIVIIIDVYNAVLTSFGYILYMYIAQDIYIYILFATFIQLL